MPIYCYVCRLCGHREEKALPVSLRQERQQCRRCGKRMSRDWHAEGAMKATGEGKGWPMASLAAAVHPLDIEKAKAHDARSGVPTEYTSEGEPIFRDRKHRRDYLKAHHLVDRDAGYAD